MGGGREERFDTRDAEESGRWFWAQTKRVWGVGSWAGSGFFMGGVVGKTQEHRQECLCYGGCDRSDGEEFKGGEEGQ
jgi:hypothetical protein